MNGSVNNSADLDLDESNDELSSLITKANLLTGNKSQPKASTGTATRRLLERQRDALRADNAHLLKEVERLRAVAESHCCPLPRSRVAPFLLGLLLGVGIAAALITFREHDKLTKISGV